MGCVIDKLATERSSVNFSKYLLDNDILLVLLRRKQSLEYRQHGVRGLAEVEGVAMSVGERSLFLEGTQLSPLYIYFAQFLGLFIGALEWRFYHSVDIHLLFLLGQSLAD